MSSIGVAGSPARGWTWRSPARVLSRSLRVVFLTCLTIAAVILPAYEIRTSHLQALVFAKVTERLRFQVREGPSSLLRLPRAGPYDHRLGYTRLAAFLERVDERGFNVVSSARASAWLTTLTRWGIAPVYEEKTNAGLRIKGDAGRLLFSAPRSRRSYSDFASIPSLVVNTLLFLEDQDLLQAGTPRRNPAVEWDRLARAFGAWLTEPWRRDGRTPGASTLATQMIKYRHSPGGLTSSPAEKLRQMLSAALRAYRSGPNTLEARRQIALDYLNSVPLAAVRGQGEIFGLGDGLHAWFGVELAEVNRLLEERERDAQARGRAYKRVLGLLLAIRRPSYYLLQDREALDALTEATLSRLRRASVIDEALYAATRGRRLGFREVASPARVRIDPTSKATDAVRSEFLELLGVRDLYALDRLDLSVSTTLNGALQADLARELGRLRDPAYARERGLVGRHLLEPEQAPEVIYSLTLFERGEEGNRLRAQVDTLEQPFNVNEGMKLDLGSTAKLRTLVHYLSLIASLYERLADGSDEALHTFDPHPEDPIATWFVQRRRAEPEESLAQLLDAALERRYAASSDEFFYTGGGLHRFRNFDRRYEDRSVSVREAFRHSVNLPFVRLMRDIVNHILYRPERRTHALLSDREDPRRATYLARFVEWEGERVLERFFRERSEQRPTSASSEPRRPEEPAPSAADVPSLVPAAQRTGEHPLRIWLERYRREHPRAGWAEILAASREARRESYAWLFRTERKEAQNRRIWTVLEREAFREIHAAWSRLGYPFAHLVPSLATAIGVSADRPAALAELLGILLNDGVRRPAIRIEEFRFAEATPYEVALRRRPEGGRRVIRPEVAETVRGALFDVVAHGTARRSHGSFETRDGRRLDVGGKTGTGDNRHDVFDSNGRLIESRVTSRTATFAFVIDERFFGVITAYVEGARAASFGFTSSLPVQVFRVLAPSIARAEGSGS